MTTFRRPLRQFLVTSLVFGIVMTSGWGSAPVLADDPSAGGQTLEAPQPNGDDAVAPDSVDALSQDMTLAPTVLAAAAPGSPRSTENAAREDTDSRYAQAQGGQFGFAALCGGLLTPCVLATPTTGLLGEMQIFFANAVTVGVVLAPWTTSPPCPAPPGPPCFCPPGQVPPWPPLAGPTAMAFLGALCGPTGFAVNIGPGPGSFTDINDAQCRDRLFAAPELGGAKANIDMAAGTRAADLCTVAGGARIIHTALCAAANAAANILASPALPLLPPAFVAAMTPIWTAWAALGPPFSDGFDTLFVASGCGIPLKLQGEMYRCGYENIFKGFIEGFFCGLAVCAPLPFGIPCFITIVSSSAAQDSGGGLPADLDPVDQSTVRRAFYADTSEGPNCGDGNCVLPENCCNCPGDCDASAGPNCGDTTCVAPENCCNCPVDCGPCRAPGCGEGNCVAPENCFNCPEDCGPCDGMCDAPENCCNSPDDCGDCMGDCCGVMTNNTPGCAGGGSPCSPSCCELVCAVKTECCDAPWDDIPDCVNLAKTVCDECIPPDFADLPELGDLDDPAFAGQLLSLIGELADMLAAFPGRTPVPPRRDGHGHLHVQQHFRSRHGPH